MAQTTAETDYSPYLPFPDGIEGVRANSSALSQLFTDMPAAQQDILEFTGALKDIADDSLQEDFISLGWGTEDDLPDPTLVPLIYVTEGTNLWVAPNNPVDFDLGDGTPASGTAWINLYGTDNASENYALAQPTGYGDNVIKTTSATFVDLSATHFSLDLAINSGIVDVSFQGNFASDADNGDMYIGFSIDDVDQLSTGFHFDLAPNTDHPQSVHFNYRAEGLGSGTFTFRVRWRRGANDTIRIYDDHAQFLVKEVWD